MSVLTHLQIKIQSCHIQIQIQIFITCLTQVEIKFMNKIDKT